jgi:hypothetical protein
MIGPMQLLDTAPAMHSQLKQGMKAFPLTNLTAANIIIHLHHPLRNIHKFGKGIVTITDSASGMFDYNWHQDDTNTEGQWEVWAELRTANGPLSSTNVEILEITNRTRGYTKHGVGRVKIT